MQWKRAERRTRRTRRRRHLRAGRGGGREERDPPPRPSAQSVNPILTILICNTFQRVFNNRRGGGEVLEARARLSQSWQIHKLWIYDFLFFSCSWFNVTLQREFRVAALISSSLVVLRWWRRHGVLDELERGVLHKYEMTGRMALALQIAVAFTEEGQWVSGPCRRRT